FTIVQWVLDLPPELVVGLAEGKTRWRGMTSMGRAFHFFFKTLCGLRLPMRPLSEPDAGSITALIRVGLPESIAAFTARFSSSGVVAFTPTPPKASIILSWREPLTNTGGAGSAPALLTSVPR